jgi:peptidyl-prolyl cis-trans isomerase SurA
MRASALLRTAVLVLTLSPVIVSGWSVSARADDTVVDGVIAVVNGKIVTKYELDERMRPIYEQTRGQQLSTDDISQIDPAPQDR